MDLAGAPPIAQQAERHVGMQPGGGDPVDHDVVHALGDRS
jgi:hypothetical protein